LRPNFTEDCMQPEKAADSARCMGFVHTARVAQLYLRANCLQMI